jgi:molybdopterin-guanine dinucleotide biosynthesis protein MobB
MKEPSVFGIYGESSVGKTELIVKLIKQLTNDGFKVATVKITNKKISIDTVGKDTWKHSKAGSKLVVLSSKIETSILLKQHEKIEQILQHINDLGEYDVVIIEGVNYKNIPKIRLGDIKERENTILTYNNDFNELVKMIKKEILRRKNMEKMIIKVNGIHIPMSEFPTEIIKHTICGMLKSLKGVEEIKSVEIKFEM